MSEVVRITTEETREKTTLGNALLVCAYESDEKFAKYHLEGAVSFSDFKKRVNTLSKDQEIIFYCN